MTFKLTWLPGVLRQAGLKVAETPGWADRGVGDIGDVVGVICHHTGVANPHDQNMPTLKSLIDGRKTPTPLSGPLAQLGLGRDGTFYVVAAGRANHAGAGAWKGFSGNSRFIGIEGENPGNDDWPDVQMDAYRRGAAAILKQIGKGAEMCCGHREYAPGRKDDPKFDMDRFRADVAAIMNGTGAVRPLIPAVDSKARVTLRRGSRGDLVNQLQQKLGLTVDGVFGPGTEAAVRQFQREKKVVPDGIVGPKTWALIAGP